MSLFDRIFKSGGPKDVVTSTQRNPTTGLTEICITATGATFAVLSEEVFKAVGEAYNKYSSREDFSRQINIVVAATTPASVLAELPTLKEKLRGFSLGSISMGPTPVTFLFREEGSASEVLSGMEFMEPK